MVNAMESRHHGIKKQVNSWYQRKTEKRGDCLVWTGARNGEHPTTVWEGKQQSVHRILWEYYKGPIPDGALIARTCGNKLCLKVAHMEAVTWSDIQQARAESGDN